MSSVDASGARVATASTEPRVWYLIRPNGILETVRFDYYVKNLRSYGLSGLDYRGPFPTREEAEDARFRDHLEGYWEHNLAVYAKHCTGCGRYAKVVAFDNEAGWHWAATECKRCGIRDPRP